DDLDRLARAQHRLHFLDGDTREVPELLLHERSWCVDPRRVLVALLRRWPIDVALERIDVGRGVCAEVDVVGVLVHVERQDGDAPCRRLAVIARVLVDEATISRPIPQTEPTRTAQ